METLYRKVAVSERLPIDGDTVFILNEKDEWQANGYFDRGEWFNDFDNECPCFPTHWLEEITDNSHQIQKLEADKAELVSYLEHVLFYVFWNGGNLNLKDKEKIESLIQKHKQ